MIQDHDEIWYTESDSDCDMCDLTKIIFFLNLEWRTDAISCIGFGYDYASDFPIFAKLCIVMQNLTVIMVGCKKFRILKIEHG